MYRIYNVHTNRNIFVGTYEELIEFCKTKSYKIFLQMTNKRDYALAKLK